MSPYGGKDKLDNAVRKYREAAGFTQEEFAYRVSLSRQSVIAIEKGRFTPSVLTALRMAAALKASVEELFQIKEESGDEN